jgi:hypothetical protein
MGINMAAAFPSKYLSANDVTEAGVRVRIQSVQMEQVDQDAGKPHKPVVYFLGEPRGMVLNVTNTNTIMDMYGQDSDSWVGKDVTLFKTHVDFQGRMVPAIRVKPGQPAARPNGAVLGATAQAPLPDSENPNPGGLPSPFSGDPLDA